MNGLSEYRRSTAKLTYKSAMGGIKSALKGLDTFFMRYNTSNTERPKCSICFIRAKEPNIPTSEVNIPLPHVTWLEAPDNLSEIRLAHTIFVSTSQKEPFGLSILEALAAGLCVLIPADKAYWDKKLTQGEHCWKYEPNDPYDLHKQLHLLLKQPDRIELLGKNGFMFAKRYAAQDSYAEIKSHIERQLI